MTRFDASAVLGGVLALTLPVSAADLPRPDHTVVVIMENHSYSDVVGNQAAPYINTLRALGANFTDSHAIRHPSEPNYLALFQGTTENLTDDSCPHSFSDANLASGLAEAGLTFVGYSESMPFDGYTGCSSGRYARKHNPWVNFVNVSAQANRTFAAFPADFGELPAVSFVVPNLCNDMHDCSVATGDAWLRSHLDGYIQWAAAHNSLFVLTFDEDRGNTASNQITTIFIGPMVVAGDDATRITHYEVLRTLEDLYGIPATGNASRVLPITSIWQPPPPTPTLTPPPSPTRMPVALRPGARRVPIVVDFRPVLTDSDQASPTPTPTP